MHCPPAPPHAYRSSNCDAGINNNNNSNDSSSTSSSLVASFYYNILKALMQHSITAELSSLTTKRFNIISFSFMFSKFVLCKNPPLLNIEDERVWNLKILLDKYYFNVFYAFLTCAKLAVILDHTHLTI